MRKVFVSGLINKGALGAWRVRVTRPKSVQARSAVRSSCLRPDGFAFGMMLLREQGFGGFLDQRYSACFHQAERH
jgi:hypothetical protein